MSSATPPPCFAATCWSPVTWSALPRRSTTGSSASPRAPFVASRWHSRAGWRALIKPLTLEGRDVRLTRGSCTSVTSLPGARIYVREYDVLRGRLKSSKLFYLRTMAQVFPNARVAAGNQEFIASRSRRVARRFLRAYFPEGALHPPRGQRAAHGGVATRQAFSSSSRLRTDASKESSSACGADESLARPCHGTRSRGRDRGSPQPPHQIAGASPPDLAREPHCGDAFRLDVPLGHALAEVVLGHSPPPVTRRRRSRPR